MEISQIYELLIDSLIMVCPYSEISDHELEEYLSELEGDYYTFFDRRNTMILYEARILSLEQVGNIELLKDTINAIPGHLWNTPDFWENETWELTRVLAGRILDQLGVERRKIA